eukprot:5952532-Prymnesium_polylepis.1
MPRMHSARSSAESIHSEVLEADDEQHASGSRALRGGVWAAGAAVSAGAVGARCAAGAMSFADDGNDSEVDSVVEEEISEEEA